MHAEEKKENVRLYVITPGDTVLILKMENLHTFFIFIISALKAVVFPVGEISVKKPLQFGNFTTLKNLNGKDVYMLTVWMINLGASNLSYSD